MSLSVRQRRSRVAIFAVALALLLFDALMLGAASGLTTPWGKGVRTWKHGDIAYYDDSRSDIAGALAQAANAWNASGARVHLHPVEDPDKADVIVRVDDRPIGAGVPGPVTAALLDAFRQRAHTLTRGQGVGLGT